jgi:hypothetical protein
MPLIADSDIEGVAAIAAVGPGQFVGRGRIGGIGFAGF